MMMKKVALGMLILGTTFLGLAGFVFISHDNASLAFLLASASTMFCFTSVAINKISQR